jgi:delta8-fatty-acid desaturase
VYDATSWVEKHPGGSTILEQYAGRDATDAFMAYHGGERRALARLETLRIGRLVDESAAPPTHLKAFRRMRDAMEGSEKLLKSDLTDYAFIIARLVVLFGGVLACVLSSGAGFKTHMFGAVLLGLFWQQSMFIGHDAGHTSITYDRKKDAMIGWCVGNLFNGVGIAWWMATHNVHHCACNSLECDPDIQHMPVFAVSNKYFGSVYSLYHRRRMTYDRLARTLVRFQHYTFYPIMAVARINLYLQTLIFLIKAKRVRSRAMEFLTLGVFATWLTTLIAQLPVGHKVPFFFLSHAVAGVIHVQICLSHFSRDVFEGRPENDEWVNMQLAGTLDIDCPRWLDWFHGGLQFQTEHHLCPRVPRHKLRAFREDVVKPYAKANGLGLHSVSFWAANAEVFRTLKLAAKQSRWAPHFSSAMHL